MNAAKVIGELRAVRKTVDALLEQLEQHGVEATPEPIYMTPKEYAERAGVHEVTVRRWLKAGLPCLRQGRVVRVRVEEADRWTAAGAAAKAAEDQAHGGRR